jgi:hypothetical protein
MDDPEPVRQAAELVAREPSGVREDDLVAAFAKASGRPGAEWRRTEDAILCALSAVRKHDARRER